MKKMIDRIREDIIEIGPRVKMTNKRKLRFLDWIYEEEKEMEMVRKRYHDFVTANGNRFVNGVLIR